MSALSRLFSDSDKPYLGYRIVENLFCKCFNAENLSRSCIAIDAKMGIEGVGIKTFVDNSPFQKIAEFDKKRIELDTGDVLEDACRVSELRNIRLDFVSDAYAIESFSYHYILRRDHSLSIHECGMDCVDIDSIKIENKTPRGFDFTDGRNEYRFNRAKSTMFKSFPLDEPLYEFGVTYIERPEDVLLKILDLIEESPVERSEETITLPLFSSRNGGYVPERSGLNQWNALGRPRNFDEIYIPYNKTFRDASVDFFPPRDTPFDLKLPNDEQLSAKICQEEGKAIMSNPNKISADGFSEMCSDSKRGNW